MSRRSRIVAGSIGLAFWSGLFGIGHLSRWTEISHHCGGETAGACFRDGLPLELVFWPILLLLTYPFARFAFAAFGPVALDPDRRSFWNDDMSPVLEGLALFGLAISAWQLFRLPDYLPTYHFFHFYWLGFAMWFAAASFSARLRHRRFQEWCER
ncbi:hypothetical protein [Sphingosinicella terrae]|uniref:hypothetical protein n=1 Tax=Sphingosinicella terrae TaxID=2172047 RepID=UPI000E0D390E|nr:hypothetical protein [Sphingosinicella terrae]